MIREKYREMWYYRIKLLIFILVVFSCIYAQKRQTVDRSKITTIVVRKNIKSNPKHKPFVRKTKKRHNFHFYISSSSADFNAAGGIKRFTISASDSWYVSTTTNSWGHLSRNGNRLILLVDANENNVSRSDYFVLTCGRKRIRIDITQIQAISQLKSAEIKSVSISHNVYIDGEKGLSVSTTFDVFGLKDKKVLVACYFYDENGNALIDTDNNYGTLGTPRNVAVSEEINPSYDNSEYTDLSIKIPYSQLHISRTDRRTLRVDVIIWDHSTSDYKILTRKDRNMFNCVPI